MISLLLQIAVALHKLLKKWLPVVYSALRCIRVVIQIFIELNK